jgi:hypothetical protein
VIGELRERFAVASRRAWLRRGLWLVLAIAALGAAAFARRTAGSWPAVARAFRRPPAEAIFLVPVAGVLVAVALTGNPLIAKALVRIAIAGIAVAWISGALLELQRPLTTRRMLAHSVIAIAVMAAAAYLAIDRDRMLDLVGETLEHGPIQQ